MASARDLYLENLHRLHKKPEPIGELTLEKALPLFPHLTREQANDFLFVQRQDCRKAACPPLRVDGTYRILSVLSNSKTGQPELVHYNTVRLYENDLKSRRIQHVGQEAAIQYAKASWPSDLIESAWKGFATLFLYDLTKPKPDGTLNIVKKIYFTTSVPAERLYERMPFDKLDGLLMEITTDGLVAAELEAGHTPLHGKSNAYEFKNCALHGVSLGSATPPGCAECGILLDPLNTWTFKSENWQNPVPPKIRSLLEPKQ